MTQVAKTRPYPAGMAFQWDDLHERAWLARLAAGRIETESKRTLAGSALHLDLAARGDLSTIPPFESIGPGRVAFEFRAPGRTTGCADVYRFYGLLGLLLERDERDGLAPDLDATTGVLIASRISKRVRLERALGPAEIEPGIVALERLRPRLVLVAADHLVPGPRTAAVILYHGTDRAAERLLAQRPLEEWLAAAGRVYMYRRQILKPALEREGFPMGKLHVDVAGVADDIGVRALIDEVGLKRVIDEVGLKRVIDEVGLKRVIDEGGLKRVIDEVGLSRLLDEYARELGRDQVQVLVDCWSRGEEPPAAKPRPKRRKGRASR